MELTIDQVIKLFIDSYHAETSDFIGIKTGNTIEVFFKDAITGRLDFILKFSI